ncbi:MAG: hypothetical protein ACR2KG_02095 [Nocardioidaceae bacterium]
MTSQMQIAEVDALEILDSRGNPTLTVSLRLAEGQTTRAAVPSGAFMGGREARELRDGDPQRFDGRGVLRAVAAVRGPIKDAICGRPWSSLRELDSALRDLDGSHDLSRLGSNAILGASSAACRAFARSASLELHDWMAAEGMAGRPQRLPVPHFNVVNGGAVLTSETPCDPARRSRV